MNLELKVPPLAVVTLTGVGMGLFAWLWPDAPLAGLLSPRIRLGLVGGCVSLGAPLGILGVMTFRRIGTTVNPNRPDRVSSLVTGGVYQWTRNPMYVAMLLGLVALSVGLNHLLALLWVPVYVGYMIRFQIQVEERFLAERYGAEYLEYCQRVRRWI